MCVCVCVCVHVCVYVCMYVSVCVCVHVRVCVCVCKHVYDFIVCTYVCMVYTCDIEGWNGNQLAPHLVAYLYSAGFQESPGMFPPKATFPLESSY